jgi:hypothetical protein
MSPFALLLGAALVVPASAGTTAAHQRSIALAASPAHVHLDGSATATVRVINSGREPAVVAVQRAGFGLDLRGRPRIVRAGKHSAQSWISVFPPRFVLPAGGSTTLAVTANVPRRAEPGDHDAVVLLMTEPARSAGLAVRLRLGVVIEIRAPGLVVHGLVLGGLRVRRNRQLRTLELLVANRGNVTEHLASERLTLALRRHGSAMGTLRPEPRDLLPRTRGLVLFRYRGRARGAVFVRATIHSDTNGSTVSRTYRIRL